MIKVFISQPMNDKTNEEIEHERREALNHIKMLYSSDEVEIIDSFFKDVPHDVKPLWYLSKSLELLSTADLAFFCSDWEKYRGCKIEHTCAVEYGIPVLHAK